MENVPNRPLVSVIIPAYNAERHLETAVDSVLAQSYDAWELFVIDDGSKDETVQVATRCAEKAPGRITLLHHPDRGNHGVAETRNLAFREAKGEYAAFLDADDRWLPAKLERQVAFMEEQPNVGLTFTLSQIHREGSGEGFMPDHDILGDHPPEDRKLTIAEVVLVRVNYVFSSVMVRAEALRAVGGFPEDLPFQSEDRIMVAKVAADHDVRLVPDLLCEYLAHDASYSTGVVQKGNVPIIFFDMQSRVVEWLARENGKEDWARDIAGAVLPNFFFGSLGCQFPRHLFDPTVWRALYRGLHVFPDMLPMFVFDGLRRLRYRLWPFGRPSAEDADEDTEQRNGL